MSFHLADVINHTRILKYTCSSFSDFDFSSLNLDSLLKALIKNTCQSAQSLSAVIMSCALSSRCLKFYGYYCCLETIVVYAYFSLIFNNDSLFFEIVKYCEIFSFVSSLKLVYAIKKVRRFCAVNFRVVNSWRFQSHWNLSWSRFDHAFWGFSYFFLSLVCFIFIFELKDPSSSIDPTHRVDFLIFGIILMMASVFNAFMYTSIKKVSKSFKGGQGPDEDIDYSLKIQRSRIELNDGYECPQPRSDLHYEL